MPLSTRFSRLILIGLVIAACMIILLVVFRSKSVPPVPSTHIDPEKRLEIERRAQAGDPAAQYELTLFLDDQNEVIKLLKKAAEAGYPPAVVTYAVSMMAENEKNGMLARKMLETVAKGGYYPAIVELTHCASQGECGAASSRTALSWAIVSRILSERQLIKSNELHMDEERIRLQLPPKEISLAETDAKLLASNIQKITQ